MSHSKKIKKYFNFYCIPGECSSEIILREEKNYIYFLWLKTVHCVYKNWIGECRVLHIKTKLPVNRLKYEHKQKFSLLIDKRRESQKRPKWVLNTWSSKAMLIFISCIGYYLRVVSRRNKKEHYCSCPAAAASPRILYWI